MPSGAYYLAVRRAGDLAYTLLYAPASFGCVGMVPAHPITMSLRQAQNAQKFIASKGYEGIAVRTNVDPALDRLAGELHLQGLESLMKAVKDFSKDRKSQAGST